MNPDGELVMFLRIVIHYLILPQVEVGNERNILHEVMFIESITSYLKVCLIMLLF
jgi:hypothetical protein